MKKIREKLYVYTEQNIRDFWRYELKIIDSDHLELNRCIDENEISECLNPGIEYLLTKVKE